MRFVMSFVTIIGLFATSGPARADAPHDAFMARFRAALATPAGPARNAAIGELFWRKGTDAWSEALSRRMATQIATLSGQAMTFAPLTPDSEFVYLVSGWEYRPNLKVVGYVMFTDPKAAKGNNTKVPYGLAPDGTGYAIPLTLRKLVNPAAPKDKELQMLVVGLAHPAGTFDGWCDVTLSNGATKRFRLHDQGMGNQTRLALGQKFTACRVRNTSGRGSLSLRLYADGKTLFERRIEMPETTITYPAP